ncbi:MAG: bifunctional [glutamate--ammonia ligase]-adenylyl-L-tyrosine phosphorylase/[glutamate--ammonia-ligase] adenylyltransferase [Steroidobacteraceae bacterium]
MHHTRYPTLPSLPEVLRTRVASQLETLRESLDAGAAQVLQQPLIVASLPQVFASSALVADACLRDAGLLPRLHDSGCLLTAVDSDWLRRELDAMMVTVGTDTELLATLRRFRRQQMVRIAWRDIAGFAELNETLLDLSNLADVCVQYVYERAYAQLSALYGRPRGRDSGAEQPLMVLGMGKLGGRELNYSSDIDLIFLYPEAGETDGAAAVDNEEFFLRLGQRMINWLANKTADGFVFRVDMRLRPFGNSGPLAVNFDSFETYLQQNGRDWERYAFVKARPLTAIEHYQSLYNNVVRPFVYRRYLDFSVFESLRNMKQMIAREVERRELHEHVKLGPGGIREVEFIVQAFQLLRGGNDRQLQSRELQQVLPRLVGHKLLTVQAVEELLQAYRFLRLVENRLQEWNDDNTHYLPEEDEARLRLAVSLNYPDWPALLSALNEHRQRVSGWFAAIVFGSNAETPAADSALDAFLDPGVSDEERHRAVMALGITDPAHITTQMLQVRDSGYYQRLDETGKQRLHVLVPKILRLIAAQAGQAAVFTRILRIIEMIGGRTVYLALLNEHPPVLSLLVHLCAQSEFLAEQIAAFPLLLDELIDERLMNDLPTRASLAAELQFKLEHCDPDDEERQLELLREFQRIALFRIAVADLTGRMPLMKVSDRLTDLAELIVQQALDMAWAQLINRHGRPLCGADAAHAHAAGVVVVAYGKFGGIELGYGSDLDLVFLHDSAGAWQQTDGEQAVDNSVFFARLGQRLVHLLSVHTRAGRLYEVDVRLRPSGKGGLLVQSLDGFDNYQRHEAWTWEHQALLRARAVAGDATPMARFEQIRTDILRKAIKRDTLREEVRRMRQRMRDELSKAGRGQFDLKQDAGGIADIEFLVQYWMLKWADEYPPIILFTDNIRQLESLASGNIIAQMQVNFLTGTYRLYRERMHHLSLAGDDNVIDAGEFVEPRRRVVAIWDEVMGTEGAGGRSDRSSRL